MQYKYATDAADYSDFASGRVFYSLPGHPAFPIRLASEILQRCLAHRETEYGISTPCILYDPCCGAAYHLSVLGYLHREHIRGVIGSDVDEKAVALAKRNLDLLKIDGLDKRIVQITEMLENYGKDSHREALQSASVLKKTLAGLGGNHSLQTNVFKANVLDRKTILRHLQPKSVDIVFTDVPYGRHSDWKDVDPSLAGSPLYQMLDVLQEIVSTTSVVAITTDKQQKARHESYERLEHFQVGKRRVEILKPGF